MKIQVLAIPITQVPCDILLIHVFEGNTSLEQSLITLDKAVENHISQIIAEQPTACQYGETTIIHTWDAISAKRIALLGMGKKAELTTDKIRFAVGAAMRTLQKLHIATVATMMPDLSPESHDLALAAQAMAEGALLGTYQFNYYKTTKPAPDQIKELILIENNETKKALLHQGIQEGIIIGQSVHLARDLGNHPAIYMTPTQLATQAEEIGQNNQLEVSILNQEDMEKEQMYAFLSVAKGSTESPKMIILKYMGDTESTEITAFVGKGVTFDSGGISIKPSLNMGDMKNDMAGAAVVLSAMLGISKLKPKVNIIGVIPCTENMPAGNASKPGDVITSMSGKTIEIITTDAEGRLILADAITYAQKLGATQIIDIATLTGACVVALGNVTSGLLTNHQHFCEKLKTAATHTGEKMWELPNFAEYKEQIKSDIADLKNSGGRMAGTITAGLFIEAFTNDLPWIHMDIAGTADSDKDHGYRTKGATGVGTRTLIQLAKNMSTK